MAASLQDRIARDARFASDVSHELRSPLMTLRASMEVMKGRQDEMSERSRAALDLLEHDVDRFERLIGDLLEISRLDAGAAGMALDRVSAARFVREAIASTGRTSTPMSVDDSATDTLVELDKRRMAQVIANLMDNADNYANGVTGIRVEQVDGALRVNIEDEGPGVPESEKSLIFERFSRGSTAGRRGTGRGSGLGLALVSEHVRLHGGRVWVEDRADVEHGSRFVVELPVVS